MQAAQIKEIFDLFDTDGGGTIDRREVLSHNPPTVSQSLAAKQHCHLLICRSLLALVCCHIAFHYDKYVLYCISKVGCNSRGKLQPRKRTAMVMK